MRKMACLRSFFKYFYRRGDLKENIMTKIDLPKIHEKSIIRLTDDEVNKMISAAAKNPRDEMIISLFLLSGIRVSELVGLDYQDIDLKNKTFLITRKGGKQTILHMGQQLHDKFANYFSLSEWTPTTPLFTKCGHRLTVRAIENIAKQIPTRLITAMLNVMVNGLKNHILRLMTRCRMVMVRNQFILFRVL